MRGPARYITLAMLAALALAGPAAARAEDLAASSPLQQARETDQVLRRLSGVPALNRALLTSTTAAAAATSGTTATAGRGLLLKNRLRPTSATLILRRGRIPMVPLAAAGATTGTLTGTSAPPPPAVPDLARLLTAPVAPPTTVTRADEIPRLDPAWLGPRRYPAAAAPAAPTPAPAAIRINTADAAELRAKLKLDATRARNIIQFRTIHGAFKEPADLTQVVGITEDMVKQWDDADVLIF